MRSYWKRNGPPLHISLVAIAKQLGIDLLGIGDTSPIELDVPDGPSVADVSRMVIGPRAGGDTLSASLEAFRLLGIGADPSP